MPVTAKRGRPPKKHVCTEDCKHPEEYETKEEPYADESKRCEEKEEPEKQCEVDPSVPQEYRRAGVLQLFWEEYGETITSAEKEFQGPLSKLRGPAFVRWKSIGRMMWIILAWFIGTSVYAAFQSGILSTEFIGRVFITVVRGVIIFFQARVDRNRYDEKQEMLDFYASFWKGDIEKAALCSFAVRLANTFSERMTKLIKEIGKKTGN